MAAEGFQPLEDASTPCRALRNSATHTTPAIFRGPSKSSQGSCCAATHSRWFHLTSTPRASHLGGTVALTCLSITLQRRTKTCPYRSFSKTLMQHSGRCGIQAALWKTQYMLWSQWGLAFPISTPIPRDLHTLPPDPVYENSSDARII